VTSPKSTIDKIPRLSKSRKWIQVSTDDRCTRGIQARIRTYETKELNPNLYFRILIGSKAACVVLDWKRKKLFSSQSLPSYPTDTNEKKLNSTTSNSHKVQEITQTKSTCKDSSTQTELHIDSQIVSILPSEESKQVITSRDIQKRQQEPSTSEQLQKELKPCTCSALMQKFTPQRLPVKAKGDESQYSLPRCPQHGTIRTTLHYYPKSKKLNMTTTVTSYSVKPAPKSKKESQVIAGPSGANLKKSYKPAPKSCKSVTTSPETPKVISRIKPGPKSRMLMQLFGKKPVKTPPSTSPHSTKLSSRLLEAIIHKPAQIRLHRCDARGTEFRRMHGPNVIRAKDVPVNDSYSSPSPACFASHISQ
jgi:hypothetical protein